MKWWRIAGAFACILIIAGGVFFAHLLYSEHRFHLAQRNFAQIQLGQSRDQVVALLGKPNHHSGACWQEFGPSRGCASEFIYSDPFEILLGDYYVVEFSSQGTVLAKERIH